MKKILFTLALTITLGFTASAQYNSDGFFKNWDDEERLDVGNGLNFVLPANHGFDTDANSTPLSSGLLILTALGAGYALKRKKK